jgi:hypothetical protein
MSWQLVKTALLGRWEVSLIGKDGLVSKHGPEVTKEQMQEIAFDFLKMKHKEIGKGFRVKTKDGYVLNFNTLEEYKQTIKDEGEKE